MIQLTKTFKAATRAIITFTVLFGCAYPLLITGFAQLIFPTKANGSLVVQGERSVGSSLIGQTFDDPTYFQPRPSAGNYQALPSAASNLSPTSSSLKDAVVARHAALGPGAPADLLTTSGSGLDPHISVASAKFQLSKVGKSRSLKDVDIAALERIIDDVTENPELGFLGKERVNVLLLNLRLDQEFPRRNP